MNQTVTITHRTASGQRDEYGSEIPTDSNTTTVGELQQTQRAEPGQAGELSVTTWLLVLPAGTAIETGDTATIGTDSYEVVGDPWHARNPRTQTESHVEATVKRTAGSEETGS